MGRLVAASKCVRASQLLGRELQNEQWFLRLPHIHSATWNRDQNQAGEDKLWFGREARAKGANMTPLGIVLATNCFQCHRGPYCPPGPRSKVQETHSDLPPGRRAWAQVLSTRCVPGTAWGTLERLWLVLKAFPGIILIWQMRSLRPRLAKALSNLTQLPGRCSRKCMCCLCTQCPSRQLQRVLPHHRYSSIPNEPPVFTIQCTQPCNCVWENIITLWNDFPYVNKHSHTWRGTPRPLEPKIQP